MAHPMIFSRIKHVRERLPKSTISLNSNGDYVRRDTLERLASAGLNELKLMAYHPEPRAFSTADALDLARDMAERNGFLWSIATIVQDQEVVLRVIHDYPISVTIHAENYTIAGLGSDRGASVRALASDVRRSQPCYAPYFELNIDYTGAVMPCCNMNSDVPDHKPFIMGDATESRLTEIYFGKPSRDFRAAASQPYPMPSPCASCHYYWPNRLPSNERNTVTTSP